MPTGISQKQAVELLHRYVFSKSYTPYVFVAGGFYTFKLVYLLTHLISCLCSSSYSGLSTTQRVEWNNRAMSTIHATFIAAPSFYVVFLSDFFYDEKFSSVFLFRSSLLSTFVLGMASSLSIWLLCFTLNMFASYFLQSLGAQSESMSIYTDSTSIFLGISFMVSTGYFIADLVMIFNFHLDFGGEVMMHHFLCLTSLVYSMLSCQGQLYTYMVLISEITIPFVNLRWYLEIAGLKKSKLYLINGVFLFFAWLFARILLFVYILYHAYWHSDKVRMMPNMGIFLLIGVPAVLGIMNLVQFGKICKGMMTTPSLYTHHV